MTIEIKNILEKQLYEELDILLSDDEYCDLIPLIDAVKSDWINEINWNYFGFIDSVNSDVDLDRSHEEEIRQIIINL